MVIVPPHWPLARQVLVDEPFKMKPLSQLNVIVFGNVVFNPNDEPFLGLSNGPQSLAVKIATILLGITRIFLSGRTDCITQ